MESARTRKDLADSILRLALHWLPSPPCFLEVGVQKNADNVSDRASLKSLNGPAVFISRCHWLPLSLSCLGSLAQRNKQLLVA
jgi:hypothetical protein